MVDLLGPSDAGASPTAATTTDVTAPVAGDSWFIDCIDGTAGSGTPIVEKWLNRVMQQMRVAIRASNVANANSYDQMLSAAIQSGYANWIGQAGGSANALTGTSGDAPYTLQAGTLIRGIATAENTGATTFNWAGLGAFPVTHIDGTPFTGGELNVNTRFVLMWDGGAWVLISELPLSYILAQIFQINIQQFDASGTWSWPPGFSPESRVIIEIWGAGGGGNGAGLGGNGGAYERFETYLNILPSTCSVIVGAGGLGSNNSSGGANAATAGGSTTFAYGGFSNAFTANGGPSIFTNAGGVSQFIPGAVGDGGAGGTASAPYNGANSVFGGGGGAGWNGSGGSPGVSSYGGGNGGAPGAAGAAPGGGGGAGVGVGATGGAGGHGRVIITVIQGG